MYLTIWLNLLMASLLWIQPSLWPLSLFVLAFSFWFDCVYFPRRT
jgi:hypothetical protein